MNLMCSYALEPKSLQINELMACMPQALFSDLKNAGGYSLRLPGKAANGDTKNHMSPPFSSLFLMSTVSFKKFNASDMIHKSAL